MFVHNVSVFLLFASTETTPAGKFVLTSYCLFAKTMKQVVIFKRITTLQMQ